MNPMWLVAGIQVGQLVAPSVRRHGKTLVREAYWLAEPHVGRLSLRIAHRRWVRSLR